MVVAGEVSNPKWRKSMEYVIGGLNVVSFDDDASGVFGTHDAHEFCKIQ